MVFPEPQVQSGVETVFLLQRLPGLAHRLPSTDPALKNHSGIVSGSGKNHPVSSNSKVALTFRIINLESNTALTKFV